MHSEDLSRFIPEYVLDDDELREEALNILREVSKHGKIVGFDFFVDEALEHPPFIVIMEVERIRGNEKKLDDVIETLGRLNDVRLVMKGEDGEVIIDHWLEYRAPRWNVCISYPPNHEGSDYIRMEERDDHEIVYHTGHVEIWSGFKPSGRMILRLLSEAVKIWGENRDNLSKINRRRYFPV